LSDNNLSNNKLLVNNLSDNNFLVNNLLDNNLSNNSLSNRESIFFFLLLPSIFVQPCIDLLTNFPIRPLLELTYCRQALHIGLYRINLCKVF
jgi:hypothetical protein